MIRIDQNLSNGNVLQKLPRENFIKIFNAIKKSPNKVTFLCADTHNFQHNEISDGTFSIDEYVFGTGGAKPDELMPDPPQETVIYDNIVLKSLEYVKPYGYGEVVLNVSEKSIQYIQN